MTAARGASCRARGPHRARDRRAHVWLCDGLLRDRGGRPRPFATGDQRSGFLDFVPATPNYFDVVGMRVVRGRRLAASDVPGSAPVVVINESAARRFWPDVDPIGRSIVMEYGDDRFELTVAGVVADTRRVGIHTKSAVAAFVSFWQVPWGRFQLVAHQPRDGGLNEDMVRRIVASIDPGVPVGSVTTLEEIVARSVARPRYHMVLMTAFGVLGVVLALVGCYGVLSYSVAQRTREIGVRIALGASRRAIVANVLARASVFIALGLIAGSALALALTRILESNLYGVTPTSPIVVHSTPPNGPSRTADVTRSPNRPCR